MKGTTLRMAFTYAPLSIILNTPLLYTHKRGAVEVFWICLYRRRADIRHVTHIDLTSQYFCVNF